MRKNIKAILVLCCIMAMVLTGIGIPAASAATVVDSLTVENIFDSLGDAANYGIVAKKWNQTGHAESNACVDEVYKNSGDPFANSNNTYAHVYGSNVVATITAPSSLQGMTFALYKEEGTGYTLCSGTEKTVDDATNTATLTWELESELYNQQLHVFQVTADGFVAEGAENSAGLTVNYGPAVFAGANNGNYLGKIIFPTYKGRGESLKVFNMTDYFPSLVLGPETRLYEMVGNEMVLLDQSNTSGSRTVYVNYYYPNPDNSEELLMDYIKLQDIKYENGTFGRDGNIIYITEMEADEPGYASKLVDNAKDLSKYLANIGGGTIDPEKGLTPNRTGSSTVTGPVTDGGVVSIYDVETGDWNLTYQADMGIPAMPVADNEYVIVNVICPNSGVDAEGNRTETLYMSQNDAGGLNYFIEGKEGKVQCGWGEGYGDRAASQRVIYNIVYVDENGVMQPYQGNIVPHNCHGGTILAPAAKLVTSAEVHNGAMIVEEVENPQEIHQRVLGAKESQTWVIMNGGNITLQKASVGYDWGVNQWQDMSGEVDLSGAVFGVYSDRRCSEDSLVTTLTTDEKGVATSGMIAAGTYWVKEITPLKDHNLSTEVFEVTVVAGQTVQVRPDGYSDRYNGYFHYIDDNRIWISGAKLVNQQNNGYASLRVLKNDEFGNVLQGAEFGVYTRERINNYGPAQYRYTLVASGFTNRNGVAIIENVPLSYQNVTYYVREIAAPDGYRVGSENYIEITLSPDDRDKIITVDGNGRAEGVAFTNTIIRGNMALRKADSKTNARLAGAEFTVYSDKACTQVVGVMTTNDRGRATSQGLDNGKDLIPGTYYVKETKAPNGYMANDTVYTVQVVADKLVDVVTGNIIAEASDATAITNDQAIHINGQKVWYDEGYEHLRPNEVKIALYKGTQFLREVTVKAPDWRFEFHNLPRYDENGEVIEYSVRENLVGKDHDYYAYVDGIDGSGNVSIIVANSIRRVNITGEKAWEDRLDYDPDRPDTITFLLYQEVDGELVPMLDDQDQHMTATGGQWNKYAFKFDNLPFYDANGDEAAYVVKEAESDKYLLIETDVTETEEQNKKHLHFTLTNRMTVALNGAKVWQDSSDYQGDRPENVTLVVYCNGERMRPQPTIIWDKTTDTDVWTWSITGLSKYDENGNAYTYTVQERAVPGYTSTVSEDGLTFYNTIYGNIQLYKRNDTNTTHLNGAQFKLYYDAACQNPVFGDQVFETASRNGRDGWLIIENVVPGDYYILEVKAPLGYALPNPNNPIPVTVVAGVNDNRVNSHLDPSDPSYRVVLNAKQGEDTTIQVNKTWVGDEGKEDARPQSVTIQLYQNGTAMEGKTLELTAANGWSGEFTKLPSVDANDASYVYTVKETAVVPGYVGTVTGSVEDGFTVTNTYNQTEITVTKKWEGPVSADNMGPVEVRLLANGTPVDGMTAVLSKDNSWTVTFENLPIADENGSEITYTVEETTALADFDVTYSGDKTNGFTVTNTAKVGRITLKKVDAETGAALGGAKFGIYTDADCQTWVADMTTGSDGTATSGDLLPGTYYVKETEAPSGYKIGKTDAVAVTVVGDQTVTAVGDGTDGAFTNEQGKGKLYVKKVGTDSSNNNAQPLADAEFTVYQYINGQKTEVGKIITDENGYGEVALPIGDYMVQETKAPDGYKINDSSEKWVSIKAVDEEVWVQGGFNYNNEYGWFQNTSTAVGSIKLVKVSAADANTKLAGAVFGVYSDQNCQNKVGEMTTDQNGEATYTGLEANRQYWVKEITAPDGYELNTQTYAVTVAPNTETMVNGGNPIPNEAEREKGAISLVKVSAEDANTKLAGAVFGVYSDESCTQEVGRMTTDNSGEATLDGLYDGETYWVKEITAPSGYVLSDAKYSVTVVANTTTAVNDGNAITNEEMDGVATIYLYKVVVADGWNASGWLAGAEFTVYKNENGQKGDVVGTMTTNDSGYAELSVPLGQFIVVETKAPDGYACDTSERHVQVSNIGDRAQVNGDKSYNGVNNCIGNNQLQYGTLEFVKYGATYNENGQPNYDGNMILLAGAEFTITANDGSYGPVTVVTDADGKVSVKLPAGKNYTVTETKAPTGYEMVPGGATHSDAYINANQTTTLAWWGKVDGNYINYNNGALINKKIEQPEGGFKFTKQDDSGNALSGAVFGVYTDEACTDLVSELTSGTDGVVSLTGLEAGKTFYIKEITAPDGYLPNETVYSVTIEADVDDKLVGDNGVITNTLRETEATFAFSKLINNYGDGELPVLDFVFTIEPLGEYDDTMLAFVDNHPVDEAFTVTVKGDEAFVDIRTALDLTIWKAGTYEFKITETVDNVPDGWFFATDEIIVSIPVTEQDDGCLAVGEILYDDQVQEMEFVNWYYGDTSFYADKVWTSYSGEESISLKLYYRLLQGKDENGETVYGPWMEYTDDYEIDLTKNDVELGEEAVWGISIENLPACIDNKDADYGVAEVGLDDSYTVTYMDTDGALITEDSNGLRIATHGGMIINTLKQGEGRLDFIKMLSFGEMTTLPAEGYTFTFTLTPDENTPDAYTMVDRAYYAEEAISITPVEENGKVVSYTLEKTLTADDMVDELQAWSYLEFTFKEPGTYTFTLQEKAPESIPDGWYYDTTLHTIQFVVTDGEDKLNVENKDEINDLEIRNELKTMETAVFKFWADSGYEDDRLETTELPEYLYVRYSTDNGATWTDYGKLTDLQTQQGITVVVEDWGDGMWFIRVAKLPAYIGGQEVQWSFVEKLPADSPYETVYGDVNNCDVTSDLTGTDEDHNCIYNIHEVEAAFEGTKTLTGKTLAAGDFSFQLIGEDGNVIETVKNDADGNFSFTTIKYGLADIGDYIYTVKEVNDGKSGVSYDSTEYQVVVTIFDGGNGKLTASVSENSTALDFTNTYAAVGEITFEGTKTIDGRDWNDGDIYSFEVYEEGSYIAEAYNDLTGKINYPTITYTHLNVGTHVYTIREISDGGWGLTVDDTVYTVTVTVTDDGSGKLKVEATGDDYTKLDFVNTYEAEGSIQLSGVKTLSGKALAAGDFSFELLNEDGTVIETVTNDADGNFAFTAIEYNQEDIGSYIYTVQEVNDEQAGITYDDTVYTMTVTVSDNGDGTLAVTADIDHTALDFTNTYEAEGSVQFGGFKTLTGRELENGEFTFELTDDEGNVLDSVTNAADGSFDFFTLYYDQDDIGTYIYHVQEVDDGKPGVTYDDVIRTVEVVVSDNGDGTLEVRANFDAGTFDFTNTYAADGSVQFAGSKTLTGKALAADDFSFELIAEDGTVIETVKNGADGAFAFTTITYTLTDIGEHTYTVKEVNDGQSGVTYDETVYEITVTVADAGDGTLTVTASDNATALDFTNTYAADGSVQFSGSKTLTGKTLAADEFSFELIAEDGTVIETVKNGADGKFAFTAIAYTLDDIGTHTYTVKEVNDGKDGITYDDTVYTVTVEVADAGDGTLTVTASDNATALDFTNTYAAEGEITFAGVKTIEGREMTADDVFTFEIKEGETVIATVENDATGKIAYPTIAYTLDDVGTHTYTVKETSTDGNGITVDTTTYEVKVTVTDNGDGTLKAEASDNAEALNFTNTYSAEGEIVLEGTKTLVGRELAAGEFSFELIDEAGNVVATATNDADGKITFTKLTYTTEDIGKTYTYEAHEIAGSLVGVTYDGAPITVKVAITDNGDGTLKVAETSESHKIAFTNTYSAEGAILLAGTKSLSGRALAAGEFSFELYDEAGNLLQTATNDAKGAFAFAEIEYELSDAGKTFTYTVKEKAGSLPGVTYDETVITVKVEVKDVGGALTATLTQDSEAIAFTNTYAAEGEITFAGVKIIEGRAMTEADVFTFEIKEGSDVLALVMNDASGKIAYPTIKYTLADVGEHTYTVRETNADGDGMKVDATVYTVTVKVTDAGDGTLKVEASDNAKALNFTNTYAADGSVQFAGSKTLTGKTLAADDFSFELIAEDGTVIETVKNGADGKFAFTAIAYTLDDIGTHTYTVKEVNDGKDGVTYDAMVYTVTVTVADAGDGTLSVTASDNATKLDFTNTYAAEGEITFAGVKTIEGREMTADDVFTFEIKEGETVIATVENDATGKIAYPTIAYTLADIGEHTYTVRETSTDGSGITVDTNTYTVTVTVTDNGDGTLKVEASDNTEALNFTNTYAAEGEIVLEGTKTLVGRELAEGEFSFELIDEAGNVVATATNDADGKIVFTKLTYTTADIGKTYTYEAHEIAGDLAGVTYDGAPITVKVAITDNGDGTLKVAETSESHKIAFTNTYSAEGAILLAGTKSLSGRALAAGEFSFELYDEAGNLLQTATNDAKGAFAFAEIEYELSDAGKTFTYTVKETAGNLPGVTYDDTVITVKVEVADVGGALTATLTQDSEAIAFTNTYEAEGEITFAGVKIIEGRAMTEADVFTFEIKEGNDVLALVMNDASGKIAYPTIIYTLADVGEHTYTVRETNTDGDGMKVDTTIHTVTVTVADAGDGTLTVTASDNATALDFTNTYAADGSVQFAGAKTLTGKALNADDFSFELIGEDGTVIETVKNGADGKFAFTAIKYELADIGTHSYTVKEVNDGQSGVTYDETVYEITVTVADAGDGTLTVTASDNATALDFTNTYAADGSVQFAGSKTLTGKTMFADDFSFELIAEDGNVIETVKNGADGKFAFTAIAYTLDDIGTHTYTVKEVNDGQSGVTYDETVYEITVTVADAGDGTLTVTASDNATALDFTNTYAADGSVQFAGAKTLTGKTLNADEFSFELIAEDGTVIETVKNGADGKFAFTAIAYTLDDIGEHTYTVKEVNDGQSGITYDDTVYTVTVEVEDAGDGSLTVTASDNATKLDFTNEYTAIGAVELSGTKTLTGKELAAGMFSFELLDAEDNVIETVENDADGKFSFTAIGYTLADAGQAYTYKVREAAGNSAGVIYDGTIYTVKVEITDNGDGTLTAEPVITRLGEVVTEITFNNIMEAPLTISKKVVGCETDEKFAITVYFYHADGKEVTDPVGYTGDLTGELTSGERVFLGHGQSITFTGLLPGMRYTVEEAANNAYETTINTLPMSKADGVCSVDGNRADFVNTLKTTTFSVTKRWDGEHGGVIMLTLYGNGEKLDPQPEYSRDGDVYTYTGLPMYNADGDLVVYSAKEKYVDGYLTIYDNIPPYDGESSMIYDGGTIINRSVTSIRVQKLWNGLAEGAETPEITLILYCNGEVMNRKQPRPDADGWYVYKNLPKYVNGELAKYRVVEDPMDGFVAVYTDPNGDPAEWAEDGYTITNQLAPATGDNSPLALWAVMFTASAALLALMLKRRRRAN